MITSSRRLPMFTNACSHAYCLLPHPLITLPSYTTHFRRTIPVRYLAQQRSASACSKWVEEPTLLLHSRYPDNMWHTWTEGLIPSFQTLRELGYLPLMEISPVGAVREVTEGVAFKQCPQVADTATATVRVAVDCMQKRGLAAGAPTFCNSNDTWCMPGVWSHIAPGDAVKRPGLLYVDDKVLDNDWGSLYTAMVGAVRSFSAADGTCFRNLIVGTSRTLRAAEKMSSGGESGESQVRLERMADALDVFVRFARSAQHRLQVNNAIEFLGYDNFYGEKLRAGVSFGQAFANIIDHTFEEPVAVLPANNPSVALLEDWEDLKHQKWMFSTERQSLTGKSKLAQVAAEAAERVLPSPVGPPPEHRLQDPRPVVTYISRWGDLNRAIVNERQVLRYIYWSYNVTLRVTSMTEHVEAVAALLAETDVLIGTHCAGWTHAMFLKPGASTLQLLPYGWRRKDGSLLRGELIRTLVHLRRGSHLDWVNPHGEFSFFRRDDFSAEPAAFRAHPAASGEWAEPEGDAPHPAWLNANTYADINHLGLYIDEAMKQAGIPKMDPALVAQLKAAKLQDRIAKETQRAVEVDVDSANAAAGAWEEADGQQLGALDESVPEEQGEDAWDEEDVDGEAEVETVDEDPEALR